MFSHRDAETDGVEPERRGEAGARVGPERTRIVAPAAAADHARRAAGLDRVARIALGAVQVEPWIVDVLAPLEHVAGHALDAVRRGAARERIDRRCPADAGGQRVRLGAGLGVVGELVGRLLAAPRVLVAVGPARGLLPLGLAGPPARRPPAV